MKNKGFTLAELLIALAILGVIATFTIPKVLNSSQSSQNTAIAKEVAGMISGAQQAYSQSNTIVAGTGPANFTQYMNYVAADTAGTTRMTAGVGYTTCTATNACLLLHNGGVLSYVVASTFGGANTTNAVVWNLDPDSTGVATPVSFVVFYNGRLTTGANAGAASTTFSPGGITVGTNYTTVDPSYIQSWS